MGERLFRTKQLYFIYDFLNGDRRSFNDLELMLLARLGTLLSSTGLDINERVMSSGIFFRGL